MSITITHSGKVTVVAGETYIIDPSLKGEVEFEAPRGEPTPVEFNIVFDESPDHDRDLKIEIEGDEKLSPNVTIADGYNGPKTEFDFKDAASTKFSIGDDVVIKKFEVSDEGQDVVDVGAFDRDELRELHKLELDGNGNGAAGDKLTLDISWMTPEELADLEDELHEEGYVSDGAGGWTADDGDADKVEVDLDLDGNGHDDFELKLHNWEHINLVSGTGPEGVVDGEEFAEVMEVGYDDANAPTDGGGDKITDEADIIDGNGGDDTIDAGGGDDAVYGGSGDDSIEGGTGNDTIFGDQSFAGGASGGVRESFEWDKIDAASLTTDNGSVSQDTGNVNVTFSIESDPAVDNGFEGTTQNVAGIDSGSETIDDNSSFSSTLNGQHNDGTYKFGFDSPVENVSFRINDIDGDGMVKVTAMVDGSPVEVELTAGSNLTKTGDDTVDSNGGYASDSSPNYSVLVEIAGPVDQIFIDHDQNGGNNSGINITDVFFDAPVVTGPEGPGNDTLIGGDGDDLIYGETGDDSIVGGEGNDTLYGDDAPDGINLIVNGSFENTTGLSGTGYGFVGDGAVPGWTDADGKEIDIHNDGRGDLDATDGNNWLDLEASPGNNKVGQDVAGVTAGQTYKLTFDAGDGDFATSSGPGENLVNVYWGGELIATIDPEQGEFDTYAFDVVGGAGDGSNRLEFEGTGAEDNFGASIDNVSLELLAPPSGPAGNDTILGGDGDDVIYGNGGDDVLRGEKGNDLIFGGDGNDSMGGAEGDDTIYGGAGDDTLTGGSGDDQLFGGSGDDSISGGSGNDSIEAMEGNNVIDAGIVGDLGDTLGTPDRGFPNPFGPPFVVAPDADPEDDRDTVITGMGDDSISTGDDNDVITSTGGNNTIDAGYDDDSIVTGDGDDLITSGEGSDTISSGGGNDTIYGGLGPSVPDAFNVIDVDLDGNPVDPITDNGKDFIDAGDGDDVVFGEDDDDTIYGGAGDDTLDGGIDNDLIFGEAGDDSIIGGQGADTMDGGTGNDTFEIGLYTDPITDDVHAEGAGDEIIGGEDADDKDVDVLDLSGGGPLKVIFDDSFDPTGTSGESGKVIFFKDAAQTEVAGELIFKEIENVIPCFTPGALIATPKGEVPVESLREGDKVITRDNGIQEVRWVGRRTLNREELALAPNLKPILIKAGALGYGLPERDMLVSPQHRVLVSGDRTQLYFNESEVLVAAKHLVNAGSIQNLETLRATYIHFMFDRHEVVLSDGAWTESFQPGDQTLSDMGSQERAEIVTLFPELATEEGISDYTAARALKSHEAKLLQL